MTTLPTWTEQTLSVWLKAHCPTIAVVPITNGRCGYAEHGSSFVHVYTTWDQVARAVGAPPTPPSEEDSGESTIHQ